MQSMQHANQMLKDELNRLKERQTLVQNLQNAQLEANLLQSKLTNMSGK